MVAYLNLTKEQTQTLTALNIDLNWEKTKPELALNANQFNFLVTVCQGLPIQNINPDAQKLIDDGYILLENNMLRVNGHFRRPPIETDPEPVSRLDIGKWRPGF